MPKTDGGDRGGLFQTGGRFAEGVDSVMAKFNDSIPYDQRFALQDIKGSIAYAGQLLKLGLITADEEAELKRGLTAVGQKWVEGTFVLQQGDEDIHTANERCLGEIISKDIAGKLHTGRSRNDQVAVDFRLWMRDEIDALVALMKGLIKVTVDRAEAEVDLIFPGYTHLQRAQPIRWSHWLLSHAWSWVRDMERFAALKNNKLGLELCPLGSSALAGNPFGIDREALAASLGFSAPTYNSLDSTSDRDFVAEFLFAASLCLVHFSRIAEDLCIYCTAEFKFVTLADKYSTGSSLMPQKKNPDSMELLRGKPGRVCGSLSGFLLCMKGLPSTYNKDLQEDKEGVFDAADTLDTCVKVLTGVVETMKVNKKKLEGALSHDLLATDVADYLVRKGLPFRETHHLVGKVVRIAEDKDVSIAELSLEELQAIHPKFEADIKDVWSFETSVERRNATGGTARSSVLKQIEEIRKYL
eukprot:TRINITY_DN18056_c0_g1_i1.p2 TRINITY_DN18056_c0_g1~~TRINITY_DN18056_c0_g1_i1.p2  ORF type:complete len:470 (+),score=222.63 TRINITY_DN18056_c0_g1_i1:61-1470(+)